MCTYSNELQHYVHIFQRTATLCAHIPTNCNIMCTYSNELQRYVHIFQRTATLCAHIPTNCNIMCTYSNELQHYVHILNRTSLRSYNVPDKNGQKFFRLIIPLVLYLKLNRGFFWVKTHLSYKSYCKSYCSTVHFCRNSSIYQPTIAHRISHKRI